MKKPEFLQRLDLYMEMRRNKKRAKRFNKIKKTPKYKIDQLEMQLKNQNERLQDALNSVHKLEDEKRCKEIAERKAERERTDPFKADKWKVVYDPNGKISTVYFNDQELYGVQRFDVDFDSATEGQTPRFTLESYGSITIETESE